MQPQYDVIILGAGMVGLVTANLCAQNNLTVALVDPKLPATWQPSEWDIRCSAVSRRTQNVLESIGVWQRIEGSRVSPYLRMEVWDAFSSGEICFDARELAEPNLGHIIENSLIIQSLWEKYLDQTRDKDRVSYFIPGKPLSFERKSNNIILELEAGQVLSGQLLVGADGAQSWLRETAHIKTKGWSYQQKALVATIETEEPHQATARQCFSKGNVLAFLPLKEPQLSSIVWSTSSEQSDLLLGLEEVEFCKELAHAFDYRLGKVVKAGERRAFPLHMQVVSNYIDERIALVGDAAHVIHPLAGQGVNLGIYDAEVLVQVLKEARNKDAAYDLGQFLLLRRYERARKGHNLAMIAGMEFFKQAFSADVSFLQGIRGLGVNLLNSSKFLKKKLMRQAMGV